MLGCSRDQNQGGNVVVFGLLFHFLSIFFIQYLPAKCYVSYQVRVLVQQVGIMTMYVGRKTEEGIFLEPNVESVVRCPSPTLPHLAFVVHLGIHNLRSDSSLYFNQLSVIMFTCESATAHLHLRRPR